MSYGCIPGPQQPDRDIASGKKQAVSGFALGILVLDLRYPLFPGNVANATTWDFPVLYKILEGAGDEILDADPAIGDMVIEAGRELEQQGVRAIIGSCGYFGYYQDKAATALRVPTFLSSLLQAPMILASLQPDQKLGILCAVAESLNPEIMKACGITDPSRIAIAGAQDLPEFRNLLECTGHYNSRQLENELVDLTVDFVEKNPDVGALLVECSDMPPYAFAIQNAVKLPVFDFTNLVNWVYQAVVRKPFMGIY
jgi:hypothetical protein